MFIDITNVWRRSVWKCKDMQRFKLISSAAFSQVRLFSYQQWQSIWLGPVNCQGPGTGFHWTNCVSTISHELGFEFHLDAQSLMKRKLRLVTTLDLSICHLSSALGAMGRSLRYEQKGDWTKQTQTKANRPQNESNIFKSNHIITTSMQQQQEMCSMNFSVARVSCKTLMNLLNIFQRLSDGFIQPWNRGLAPCAFASQVVVRCGEMWWDVVRCGEMWWDVVRCGEMYQVETTCYEATAMVIQGTHHNLHGFCCRWYGGNTVVFPSVSLERQGLQHLLIKQTMWQTDSLVII